MKIHIQEGIKRCIQSQLVRIIHTESLYWIQDANIWNGMRTLASNSGERRLEILLVIHCMTILLNATLS